LVEQAGSLSLRQGTWKYIEPSNGQKYNRNTATETGNDTVSQLYDLSKDLGERTNVAAQHPERVKAMAAQLQTIRQNGRSR
jgi:arylsulfatase A-like enzyme